MKKLISLFLSLIMIVSVVAVGAVDTSAATIRISYKGVSFNLTPCGSNYAISLYYKTQTGQIEIPDTYNGKVVIAIADNGFSNSKISSVILPESIHSLGNYAFYGCKNLSDVILPNSIININLRCFEDSSVENINLPENLEYIGQRAFYNCSNLKSVVLPSSLKTIENNAFGSCSNLDEIIINNGLENIPDGCFSNSKIKSIELPDSIRNIAGRAFCYCYDLENVVFSNNLKTIGDSAFNSCSMLKTINLPNGLVSIGISAFTNCSNLVNFSLPQTVTEIKAHAFADCPNITNAKLIPSATIQDIYAGTSITSINIPEAAIEIGDYAFERTKLTSINIPSSVKIIGYRAFYGCEELAEVTIPDSVEKIDRSAFKGCKKLTSVYIGSNVNYIGSDCFSGCGKLNNVEMDYDSVDYVGTGAFPYRLGIYEKDINANKEKILYEDEYGTTWEATEYKDGYEIRPKTYQQTHPAIQYDTTELAGEYIIPNHINGKDVIKIEDGAFCRCPNVTSVTIPETVTEIGASAFYIDSGLNITIPETVKCFGNDCLNGCKNALVKLATDTKYIGSGALAQCKFQNNSINLSSVENIGQGAFYICDSLENVNISSHNIDVLDRMVFDSCKNLTNVTLPGSIKKIEQWCFSNSGITSIDLPESLEYIGEGAFRSCKNLRHLTIPKNTKEISAEAFKASGLVSVDLGSIEKIYDGAFRGCENLTSITFPQSLKEVVREGDFSSYYGLSYGGAFEGCTSLQSVDLGSVEHVGMETFKGCSSISYLRIPDTIEFVGANAFSNIGNIEVVEVGSKKFSYIDSLAFNGTKIEKYILQDSINMIDTPLIAGNTNKMDIMMRDDLDTSGKYVFHGDENLTVYTPTRLAHSPIRISTKSSDIPLIPIDGIIESGDSKDAIVILTTDPAVFKVTVPTVLPFTVDSDSNVTVANNAVISNKCNGQVKVTNVRAQTTDGWAIVANDTDFREVSVDSKQFTFTLNGDNFGPGNNVNLTLGNEWTVINGKEEMSLPYSGTFAVQSQPKVDLPIANTIFTIAWNKAA